MSFKSLVVSCRGAPHTLVMRAAFRVRRKNGPLTPCACAVLALIVAAILLAVLITMSPAGCEFNSAVSLFSWFA